jgi:hypothetical protein
MYQTVDASEENALDDVAVDPFGLGIRTLKLN